MRYRTIITVCLSGILGFTGYSQHNAPWQNKKCAIVLTYDDALNVHLDQVIPALDSLGIKGTFYLSGYFPGFKERVGDWRAAAKNGHELGNHTLYHPCLGNLPGREWVKPDYALENYSIQRMTDEISMANTLLEAIDSKKKRTFAYPCGESKIGGIPYLDNLKDKFVGARGVKEEMTGIQEIDLYNVGAYTANGQSGDELISLAKLAIEKGELLVFLFHGVGGEHSLNVSLSAHSKLLHFLKENEKEIWTGTFMEITEYINEYDRAVKSPKR